RPPWPGACGQQLGLAIQSSCRSERDKGPTPSENTCLTGVPTPAALLLPEEKLLIATSSSGYQAWHSRIQPSIHIPYREVLVLQTRLIQTGKPRNKQPSHQILLA